MSASIAGLLNALVKTFIEPGFSVAPFTEEIVKGSVLLLMFKYMSSEYNNALDGIIYGALVGIGFALVENAGYFLRKVPSETIADQVRTGQFFVRVALKGLAGHATYTAITGLSLGISRSVKNRIRRIAIPLLGLSIAIAAHALWNNDAIQNALDLTFISSSKGQTAARVAIINGPFFFGVATAVMLALKKESRIIIQQLVGELNEKDNYISLKNLRNARVRNIAQITMLNTHGIKSWWTLRRIQRAFIDLAFIKQLGSDPEDIRIIISNLKRSLPET